MYNYKEQKKGLFTDYGQKLFIAIRDQVNEMLDFSGAVRMEEAIKLPKGISYGDNWLMMACIDRIIELKEIREIPTNEASQNRVFVRNK